MKVCQVLASRGTGGLERHFVDLCNGLAARHQVIAVAPAEFGPRLAAAVRHEALDLTGWRYDPRALWRLARTLRRHRPDLVHAQANKAAAMVAALRSALGPAHCVATIHNLKRDRRAFAAYEHIIAVSRRTAAQFDPSRVTVVHNGIPPCAAAPLDCDYLDPIIGTAPGPVSFAAGRLVPAKGFDLLLQAWTGVASPLIIAGDGPERARLEDMIKALALDGRVFLIGFRRDVPALLHAAELVVLPSRREGFPYFLLEALCAGRVVVSARVPGADEILPEDYLVPIDDVPALTTCLTATLSDLPAAHRTFAPVWRRTREEFTLDKMITETEAVYVHLMNPADAG